MTVKNIEFETKDGAVYQMHRPTLKRILKASYAEERRTNQAAADADELNRTWDAYHAAVNMTHAELAAWNDDPCSQRASLTREPIKRNLHLLDTSRSDWGEQEVSWAKQTIAFVARMSQVPAGDPVSDECDLSKRTIALRNWGHDPNKSTKSSRALKTALARDAQIALKSEEEQTVFGLVLEPNDGEDGAPLNPDTQNEIYGRDVIRTAAHGWMLNHRLFDVQHEVYLGEQQAKVVESYLAPVDFDLTLPDGTVRRVYRGTWLVVVKILDQKLWAAIKDGAITGFSMNGFVSRQNVKVRRKKSADPADTLCLYHRDQDGAMSAAVVLHATDGPVDCVSVQYGEPFPFEAIAGRSRVYVVDFTPQPFCELECLAELCDAAGVEFVLVDHHASAVREIAASPLAGKIHGLQESAETDGQVDAADLDAGCDLAWRLLCPDEPGPEVVRLIGRWDVWDHADDDLVRPLAFALESASYDPAKFEALFSMSRDELEAEYGATGRAIIAWSEQQNERRLASAFALDFGGLRCLAVNTDAKGSIQFECADRLGLDGHEAGLTVAWRSGHWSVSMYALADGVDVGAVCVEHGGGGHRGAAGFNCDILPFSLA